ncbi:PD40 domain-containing protein [Flagellimonas eckloniae]|uniref:WD40 repeat protein n=1 Tax=Flagellimonas eckloniae TaxID=346185 RepID=A0A0Q1BG14_9FLAO|nr:PD40 domain-containing protein [Allomuricauda eckloniae]KQC29215.1 hypothetical protein AAY42_04335 [Allomuricauda eckloniae]
MRKIIILSLCCISSVFSQKMVKVEPALQILKNFDKVRDFTMNTLGTEAYFTIQSADEAISVICKSHKEDGEWLKPTITSFSGKHKDLEPFLSPNNLRLYFVSTRALNDSISEPKDFDIWYVERVTPTANWSEPINLGVPVNTEHNEFYPAIAKNGNLYFTSDRPDSKGRDDIFFSAYENGIYAPAISLDESINSEGFEYNAYISTDESYLLFGGYNRKDGQGSGDIYISFKNSEGNWSKATPLPQSINSKSMDYCPFVDEKNNILYFTSRRTSNPEKGIKSISALKEFLNSYENGNSRLYKASFNLNAIATKK